MNIAYKTIKVLLIILSFTSCTKEIDLNYKSVDKLHVIEGFTNDTATIVSITQTTDMYQPIDTTPGGRITNASVKIEDSKGISYTLMPNDSGLFVNKDLCAKDPSESYRIVVNIDKKTYETAAQLMPRVEIDTLKLFSQTVMKPVELQSVQVIITVEPMKEYYLRFTLYHKGKELSTQLRKKEVNMKTQMSVFFIYAAKDKDGKIVIDSETKEEIEVGDVLEVELQHLDAHTYNYLISVANVDQTNYNPISHFSGGALGYYHSYFISKKTETYSPEKVHSLD